MFFSSKVFLLLELFPPLWLLLPFLPFPSLFSFERCLPEADYRNTFRIEWLTTQTSITISISIIKYNPMYLPLSKRA